MNRSVRGVVLAGACLLLALSTNGCTMASGAWPVAQSHFAYPNSNVVPLGQGKGEASRVHWFTIMAIDPDVQEEAVQNAIKQKGGDMLLDYYAYYTVKQYIPMILTTSEWTVEGTVAKMEIGKQKLR